MVAHSTDRLRADAASSYPGGWWRLPAALHRFVCFRAKDEYDVFDTLSDRLATTFKTLRGKGRLSPEDIEETLREIRVALLEADVSLQAVRPFIAAVRERAAGAEVSRALNPAQQIVKIVN